MLFTAASTARERGKGFEPNNFSFRFRLTTDGPRHRCGAA
jgi:hypothetical protein